MRTTATLALVLLLAGCVSADPPATESLIADTAPPEAILQTVPAPNVTLVLPDSSMTTAATTRVGIQTDAPVSVVIRRNGTELVRETVQEPANWTLELAFGGNPFSLVVLGPGLEMVRDFLVTRLGLTTLTLDYDVFHPQSQGAPKRDRHDVWIDPDARPSAPLYEKQKAKNLDAFTAHDQLVTFEHMTGTKVEYGWSASFQQFSVNRIDGAGNPVSTSAPPWWCYTVNGKSGDGISIQRVAPGDSVVWRLGTCS